MMNTWLEAMISRCLKPALVLVGLSLMFAACYPGSISDVSQTDVVATFYDKEASWGTLGVVTVLDTVVHVIAEDATDTIDIPRDYDQTIIQSVKDGFDAYGYSFIDQDDVSETNQPDAFVLISMTASKTTVIWQSWNWWGYWGWYPGYPGWGPGWGWYYPPCCSYGASSWVSGTILVDMLDAEGAENDTIPVFWSMGINGVAGTTAGGTASRITRDINAGFLQSPYLQHVSVNP
jgi:hypothetical protein